MTTILYVYIGCMLAMGTVVGAVHLRDVVNRRQHLARQRRRDAAQSIAVGD